MNLQNMSKDQKETAVTDWFSALILSTQNSLDFDKDQKEYLIELLSDQMDVELQCLGIFE